MSDLDFENIETSTAASASSWQTFLRKWQAPIAFGPFTVFIFICLKWFPNATANWFFMAMIFATIIWALFVPGYCLYLRYLD